MRSVSQGGRFSPRHRIRKAAGFPCAVCSARRRAFRARSVPQGGGFPARGSPKRRGFPCAVRSAKGVRFSLRYRFSKAAGSRRAAPLKRRAFRVPPVSAGRPAFVAPPYPQGGGLLRAAAPKRRAFRVRSVSQGGRRSPRRRIRKAAGFPCAVRFARRPALAAPPHPQGGGFSSCGYPQSGGLSVRGPFRKAAGSCAQPPPKAAGFPCTVISARRPAFVAPSVSARRRGFPCAVRSARRRVSVVRPPCRAAGFGCARRGGGPAVQPSSRSSQAVHTPRSDVQDGHTHCPQPGQSVRQRVSSMRAQREHWACAKAIHLLFASPWALGRRVP